MNEIHEVVDVSQVPAIADDTLLAIAEQAEKRADAMNKIKKVALKMTNKHDWTDQGGKPYLQVSGAEKIARLFGISWRIDEPVIEHEEGGHYSYTYKGYFTLAGATIEAIGTRSSKDGFFKKYEYKKGENGEKSEKMELPASAIDKGDVKKAAYTNLLGNGISRILGIRNLTYEDLNEYAGITADMISKVGYKKEGKANKPIASEGATLSTIIVKDVRKKEGKSKAGKSYTVYTIIDQEGGEYKTFSESFAIVAKQAKENLDSVDVTYTTNQYGHDIENLTLTEPKGGDNGDSGKSA